MAKLEQILNIEPLQELKFVGPFTKLTYASLKLSNPTDNHVLFKIKTTAPRKYCVRPNAGMVRPRSVAHVQVMLQPFVVDLNEKSKHKFMVQTLIWNPEGDLTEENTWRDAKPEALMDTKLKCVFEMPNTEGGDASKKPKTLPSSLTASKADNENSRPVGDTAVGGDGEIVKPRKEEFSAEECIKEENAALMEELRTLRSQLNAARTPKNWSQVQPQASFQPPIFLLAVVAGLIGIILGKFLL